MGDASMRSIKGEQKRRIAAVGSARFSGRSRGGPSAQVGHQISHVVKPSPTYTCYTTVPYLAEYACAR